jgi:membrane protein YdbS with pleckstrin-like domain
MLDMNYYNQKTRITASIIGVLLGIAGFINHGFFEVLQGNTPTNGFFIEAIGKANRFWIHGTEGAFTIIPNFLVTGICVMLVSLAIILWSVKYIQVKHGATVFLTLLILLTFVGGGIGHIILFLPTWAYATRINKSLDWWRKILPERLKKALSKLWLYGLTATSLSWLITLELGIFGYFPGQTNPDTILNIVFVFLFSTVILANLTFICGFTRDIEKRKL